MVRNRRTVIPRDAPMFVNARVSLQEPVELAGDIADQAASELAVSLALSPSLLGRDAGRWIIEQPGQDDEVQGLVEERRQPRRQVCSLQPDITQLPSRHANGPTTERR
jgi:hypothetical protein